jgi:16S rRNA G966 N2-methylase RsmD
MAVGRLSGPPYTLVLSDPPYYDVDAFEAVRAVAGSPLADGSTLIVVEHRRETEPPELIGGYALYRSRRHGDTVVSIYAQEDSA